MDEELIDHDPDLKPSLTHIREVNGKGRGAFASVGCAAGSIIDEAHTIEFSPAEFSAVNSTMFRNYYFIRDTSAGAEQGLLVLGKISLLNHSANPNAIVEFIETREGVVARLKALREIRQSEEITIDYEVPLWFDCID